MKQAFNAEFSRIPIGVSLGSLFLAWIIYVSTQYAEGIFSVSASLDYFANSYYSKQPEWIIYVIFLSQFIFVVGQIIAKKYFYAEQSRLSPIVSNYQKRMRVFLDIMLSISIITVAWSTLGLYIMTFGPPETDFQALPRLINVYIPIVLDILLILFAILFGFIFINKPHTLQTERYQKEPAPVHTSRETEESVEGVKRQRSATAFSVAIPLLTGATALLVGLIVYDFSSTPLPSWVWAMIWGISLVGPLVGLSVARRPVKSLPVPEETPRNQFRRVIAPGAEILNIVWASTLIIIILLISLPNGSISVRSLFGTPSLSIDFLFNDHELPNQDFRAPATSATYIYSANGLLPYSPVAIRILPEDLLLEEDHASEFGDLYGYDDNKFPETLRPGEYQLVMEATGVDFQPIRLDASFQVTEQNEITATDSHNSSTNTKLVGGILSISWFIQSFLPQLALLLFALFGIYFMMASQSMRAFFSTQFQK